MDRLSPVILCALVLWTGCERQKKAPAGEVPVERERFNAVAAKPTEAQPGEMCDQYFPGDDAPTFSWPALTTASPKSTSGWRWISLWATWCKPCIREMPMLADWQKRFAQAGRKVDLQFVSVDEDDDTVKDFRAKHPATPPSLRLADANKASEWLKQLKLRKDTPVDMQVLPMHIFVDPDNRIRCVRASEMAESDYQDVLGLLH